MSFKKREKSKQKLFRLIIIYIAIFLLVNVGFSRSLTFAVEVDDDEYVHIINKLSVQEDQIKKMEELVNNLKASSKILAQQIKVHEAEAEQSLRVERSYKKIRELQEADIRYLNRRIALYRKEVEQLESKGTKNRIDKLGTVATNTGTGCLTGSLFAGVGLIPGCAIGFITGVTKQYFKDLM